jgi:hypothetical protein
MKKSYSEFVAQKLTRTPATGIKNVPALSKYLFPFQRDLVRWALRRGRTAIFASTGLGKTPMQLEWARHVSDYTKRPVLVLAPLAVAQQTQEQGARMGIDVALCRDSDDLCDGVNVANYERLHRFDCGQFGGVVLDESSIIKHHDAKTLGLLMDAFAQTPFKLCATATPAPNDYTELGTHAEFLGVCSRAEMLSEFFCHDGGETQVWRVKGHARQSFWRFVASWGALVRMPSDLGYEDGGYQLPPLNVEQHIIPADREQVRAAGLLFAEEASTLSERRDARRASISARVRECAAVVNDDNQPWIVWCDLNAESDALRDAIPGALEVRGSDSLEDKEQKLRAFSTGNARVLITKPSIAGFGLNWQHCARVAFVGVTDSWEAYYQAVRRCWRFGQNRPVNVHVFASELEGEVVRNLQRKEADALRMAEDLSTETRESLRSEVFGQQRQTREYEPNSEMQIPNWLIQEAA